MRKLTILGATGSIGSSTLAVAAQNPDLFEVVALAAGSNSQKMFELCQQWQPKYAAMASESAALELAAMLKQHQIATEVLAGEAGMCHVAALDEVDTVMAAIVGAAGLLPTMAAVKTGKRILLANKEALVMSGQMFIDACREYGAELLP
ncbi:1-deoxy-D-xylulose-5-phosphate reductoisomerase, partial [Photobacterium aphoticum]